MRKFDEQDAVIENLENAKKTALSLVLNDETKEVLNFNENLLNIQNLEDAEKSIKTLHKYADTCWLLSSLIMYSVIYDKELYKQSGLEWTEYIAQAKKRMNIDRRELYEALTVARFFVNHCDKLIEKGWTPKNSFRKLRSCELALELCGDIDMVIDHLISDTIVEFRNWYSSFRVVTPLPSSQQKNENKKRKDIVISNNQVTINGEPLYSISTSENIPEEDKIAVNKYLIQIYEALRSGYIPVISFKESE